MGGRGRGRRVQVKKIDFELETPSSLLDSLAVVLKQLYSIQLPLVDKTRNASIFRIHYA